MLSLRTAGFLLAIAALAESSLPVPREAERGDRFRRAKRTGI